MVLFLYMLSVFFFHQVLLPLFPSLSFPVSWLLNLFLITLVRCLHPQRVSLNLHIAALGQRGMLPVSVSFVFVDLSRFLLAAPPLPTSIVLFFRVSSCYVTPVARPPALPVFRLRL